MLGTLVSGLYGEMPVMAQALKVTLASFLRPVMALLN